IRATGHATGAKYAISGDASRTALDDASQCGARLFLNVAKMAQPAGSRGSTLMPLDGNDGGFHGKASSSSSRADRLRRGQGPGRGTVATGRAPAAIVPGVGRPALLPELARPAPAAKRRGRRRVERGRDFPLCAAAEKLRPA